MEEAAGPVRRGAQEGSARRLADPELDHRRTTPVYIDKQLEIIVGLQTELR
jgi:hypothetical protein